MCLSYTNIYKCKHTRAYVYSCLRSKNGRECLLGNIPKASSPFSYVCAYLIQIYTNAYTRVLVYEEKSVVSVFLGHIPKLALFHVYVHIMYKCIQMHTHTWICVCARMYCCFRRNKRRPNCRLP